MLKLVFLSALLITATQFYMVAEARGPIVNRRCLTVDQCQLWCDGCTKCECRDNLCTCTARPSPATVFVTGNTTTQP
ncbi:hypothetical protein AALP_AA1G148900 [Arabis alpina]|uniref:Uncharacterized protein n=1 Tax=Arabis alpina TaxID=50452 RepID=A0A087HNA8_ARAAL|nr:hypothetical protein AALP_AA1G148900 [Arabis alpina]